MTIKNKDEIIAEYEAELKKYKDMAAKGLEEFKDVGGCWGCGLQLQLKQNLEDIKHLKAENETLKKVKDFACINLKNYIADNNKLEAENERLKQEWRLDCLKCEYKNTKADVNKYKQTLQEIKAIAEEYHHNKPRLLCNMDKFIEQILQKITKAEEE